MSYELNRIAGSHGSGVHTGTSEFTAPSGYLIAGIVVRSTGATIASAKDQNGDTVTSTWLTVALDEGEIVTLENGWTKFTLTNASDSVAYYLIRA